MSVLYKEDGVDIPLGDAISAYAAEIVRSAAANSPYVVVTDHATNNFRGPKSFRLQDLPADISFDLAPDGIGTKTALISAALTPHLAALDLVAMTGMDHVRWGGLPLVFTNVLDVSTLGTDRHSAVHQCIRELFRGLGAAAMRESLVLFRGETAELGSAVGGDGPSSLAKFNWAGMAFGVQRSATRITGDNLLPGDIVFALPEKGFRSNGISAVRSALAKTYGAEWWANPEARDDIFEAATPSAPYIRFLTTLNGWYAKDFEPRCPVKLIGHITGGGIPQKFFHDLLAPRGFSAILDDLCDLPPIMQQCAEYRGMSDEDIYSVWGGGQGALVVVGEEHKELFMHQANSAGQEVQECGMIVRMNRPTLMLTSKYSGKALVYEV